MYRIWAPLPLRLILGIGFIYHGFPKLFSSAGHEGFAAMLQGIGVPAPALTAWIVAIVESLGGLALIAGAYVAVAAVPLAVNMLVALFTVHLPMGFSFMNITGCQKPGPCSGCLDTKSISCISLVWWHSSSAERALCLSMRCALPEPAASRAHYSHSLVSG